MSEPQLSLNNLYPCGPISVQLQSDTTEWQERAVRVLSLYSHWEDAQPTLTVHIHTSQEDATMLTGNWLRCVGMNVDKTPDGLVATCRSGAYGVLNTEQQRWDIFMPRHIADAATDAPPVDDNLEDLLELALTTAWREAGWIPWHAGAVVQGARCALIVAPSRGGKTTFTVAMLHRGYKTLGDDKLLVKRSADGCAKTYALQSVFNIDPQTNKWFPEVGDLSTLPLDSIWTPKRRLPIEHIWQERMVTHAEPTHLVQVQRYPDERPTRAEELNADEVLWALLHQTVIPADRRTAGQVLSVAAALAKQVRGVRLELGINAYDDSRTLDLMEQILYE